MLLTRSLPRPVDLLALQRLLHETRDAGIVVDIEDSDPLRRHQTVSGTCITEKNRPSWRMAFAKAS